MLLQRDTVKEDVFEEIISGMHVYLPFQLICVFACVCLPYLSGKYRVDVCFMIFLRVNRF